MDRNMKLWLMNITGLGPGIGDVHHVCAANSQYYAWLRDDLKVESSKIHFNVPAAYAELVASRNDCLLLYPGAHVLTAELAWAKANTHLIGLGGPNIGGDYSEPNTVLYTITAAVASTLTVSGANCQFHNFVVENNADNAGNLAAATVDIYGTYWKNVAFHGHMAATQNTTAAAASLYIGGSGMYPLFEDCIIGQDVWGTRSGANSGVLRFNDSTGRPNGGIFRRCQFLSRSITAACAMVALPAAQCTGRSWLYDQCHFSNFYDETTLLTQVFYTVTGTQKFTHQLRDCTAAGFTEWQTGDFDVVLSNAPITGTGGGLMKAPTGIVGT